MAGVKISKLNKFEDVFHDHTIDEFIDSMIVPVTLGNKTISLKIVELTHYINMINDSQNEIQNQKISDAENSIIENKELINQLTGEILEKINEIITTSSEEHNQINARLEEVESITNAQELNEIKSNINEATIKNQEQDIKLNDQNELIIHNKELLDKLTESITNKINELKEKSELEHKEIKDVVEENEKVTALSLIDLNQISKDIISKLYSFKEESSSSIEELKNEQNTINKQQNEMIDNITSGHSLWEIYNEN